MPLSPILVMLPVLDAVDSDGCWTEVAGAAGFAAFLDAVVVVADAFECSWAGAVPAFGDARGQARWLGSAAT